jgi:serine/threonine protein kinase
LEILSVTLIDQNSVGRNGMRIITPEVIPGKKEDLYSMDMEYFEGQTLTQAATNLPKKDKVEIRRQLNEAITHMHNQGIVHQDIKSDNILVRKNEDGSWDVKIIDFGMAMESYNDRHRRSDYMSLASMIRDL